MKSYHLICLFTFLLSFVNEAFRPANSTAIAFYCKEENRTRSYALNRLAINIGWAVGSGIGGLLAKHSYELLFWVDGFTNIANDNVIGGESDLTPYVLDTQDSIDADAQRRRRDVGDRAHFLNFGRKIQLIQFQKLFLDRYYPKEPKRNCIFQNLLLVF